MAREIIKENHPLNETPLHVAFPVFTPFASCLKPAEGEGSKEPLIKKEEKPTLLTSAALQKIMVKPKDKKNMKIDEE